MPKPSSHLVALARHGAAVRLRELAQEAQHLLDLFPDIRDSFDKDELPLPFIMATDSGAAARTRGRRTPVSAPSKKAVRKRSKKYWAKRRKA